MGKKKKQKILFISAIIFTLFGNIFMCEWIVVAILLIGSLIVYKKTNDFGFVWFPLLMISMGIYDEIIKPLWEDYNPIVANIAYELNIKNDYEIQEYYKTKGYRIDWIGKASNIIYASAEKIITIPCSNTKRYDKFLISGTHIEQLKSSKSIPKIVFDRTEDAQQILMDNEPDPTYGYR